MNKYQRAVLLAAGSVISAVQLYAISENGIDESWGWAVSFLIAAGLLFIGLSSSSGNRFWRLLERVIPPSTPVPLKRAAPLPRPRNGPLTSWPTPPKPDKHAYGIHISELDLAIESVKAYTNKTKVFYELQGNGKSLNWNCCALIYASMRYATRKAKQTIHRVVWNTITHSVVVRMTTDEKDGVGVGDPGYESLEAEAYRQLELIDKAVEDALAGKGPYELEPVVRVLAAMFGARDESVKALAAAVGINANTAHTKIIPEMVKALS